MLDLKPTWVPECLESENDMKMYGSVCVIRDKKNTLLQLSHIKGSTIILNRDEIVSLNVFAEHYCKFVAVEDVTSPVYIPLGTNTYVEIHIGMERVFFTKNNTFIELCEFHWERLHDYVSGWVCDDAVMVKEVPQFYKNKNMMLIA